MRVLMLQKWMAMRFESLEQLQQELAKRNLLSWNLYSNGLNTRLL